MNILLHIVKLIILTASYFKSASSNHCLKHPLFSTKTPYNLVGNTNTNILMLQGCHAIQINMVHRHGNRYPSKSDVGSIVDLFNLFQFVDQTLVQNISLPKKNPFSIEHGNLLNEVGEKDFYDIGQRIRKRFPQLFNKDYSPSLYKFVSSCKTRCLQSSSALASGLFEGTGALGRCQFQPVAIESHSCDNDMVLRFFDLCQKYILNVKKSAASLEEMNLFSKRPEIKRVINKVEKKLGLFQKINGKHLEIMYLYCAYEIGIFNGKIDTGLCSLFDKEDLYVLEYYLDLKHYYRRSGGFPINFESSCPLLADVLSSLKRASLNQTEFYRGIFRSAHAETIIPFNTILGINLDNNKLTAKNFEKMKNRKFRPSCISPFSGNLYFVLYDCGSRKHKIQLYINEWLVKIPCCESEYDCDFDIFLKYYERIADECHFNDICSLSKTEL